MGGGGGKRKREAAPETEEARVRTDSHRSPHAPRTMSWRCAARRAERTGPAARSPPLPPLLLLLWTAALAPGAAAGDEAAPAGASVCYASPPSVGSVQELVERAAVVIEGKLHPPRRRQQGALDREAAAAAAAGEAGAWGGERPPPANGTVPAWPTGPAPSAAEPGAEAPYLVKVHQVWAAKAGGLKKDSLLTVRLGAWGRPAFRSCGRLKEDSRYIFFMEPEANSSGRAPAAFRASFPPLETGRNLKKEVSRVLCKRCGKFLGPRGALGPGGEGGEGGPPRGAPGGRRASTAFGRTRSERRRGALGSLSVDWIPQASAFSRFPVSRLCR